MKEIKVVWIDKTYSYQISKGKEQYLLQGEKGKIRTGVAVTDVEPETAIAKFVLTSLYFRMVDAIQIDDKEYQLKKFPEVKTQQVFYNLPIIKEDKKNTQQVEFKEALEDEAGQKEDKKPENDEEDDIDSFNSMDDGQLRLL